MVPNREHKKHKVFNVSYHIVWIPKYRRHILNGPIEDSYKRHLFEKAAKLNITIEAMEIMPDHIHLFIKARPDITISDIVKHLKGYSSYALRKEFTQLRRMKSLWTKSYYAETIGLISESTIRKYIEMQKYR